MRKYLIGMIFILMSATVLAATPPITINNNSTNNYPTQNSPDNGQQAQQQANNSSQLDPRVPPAGVYSTREADGSTSTTYTTGETKPYNVDNGSSNSQQPVAVYPQINPNPSYSTNGNANAGAAPIRRMN